MPVPATRASAVDPAECRPVAQSSPQLAAGVRLVPHSVHGTSLNEESRLTL
jgi:hypothetical protein